jgi:hypothetical protein
MLYLAAFFFKFQKVKLWEQEDWSSPKLYGYSVTTWQCHHVRCYRRIMMWASLSPLAQSCRSIHPLIDYLHKSNRRAWIPLHVYLPESTYTELKCNSTIVIEFRTVWRFNSDTRSIGPGSRTLSYISANCGCLLYPHFEVALQRFGGCTMPAIRRMSYPM